MPKRKETKLLLLEDGMIPHLRGPEDPTRKHLEQLGVVRTVVGYKSTCESPFIPIINMPKKKLGKNKT